MLTPLSCKTTHSDKVGVIRKITVFSAFHCDFRIFTPVFFTFHVCAVIAVIIFGQILMSKSVSVIGTADDQSHQCVVRPFIDYIHRRFVYRNMVNTFCVM